MFWGKAFGQKVWTIATIWVENSVNYSVLKQVVWKAGLMLLGKKTWAIGALWVENTVICSVLRQVVWQESLGHWCNQCFGASCLEGRLGPFMLHGSKTLLFSMFLGNLFGKKAWAGAAI